ncbi:MAG TPA: amino acid-binding protein, partial [Acetobacteraceae bacterium]|nr:amino acid-binding protein [Acetobacteraceae bacterium]
MKPCLSRRALIAGLAASSAAVPAVARAAGKQPAPDLPLVVGSIFPFSGPLALVGDEAFRGVTLAVDAINGAGGVGGAMVRLLHQDAVASADAEGAVKAL